MSAHEGITSSSGTEEVRRRTRKVPGICVKCREEKACAYVRDTGYCQPCFIHQMTGKVRTHLTRTPLPGDFREVRGKCKVVVAFSGGPSSRVLLDMVAQYTGGLANQQARRFGEISVVHVDESILEGTNGTCAFQEEMRQVVESYGMSLRVVRLESAFSTEEDPNGTDGFEACCRSYEIHGSKSSMEDMVRQVKLRLLRQAAMDQGATILMTGDSATRTAIHTLLEITQGRGYTLPFLVGPTSTTGYSDLVVWRPLRDCLAKEMDQYVEFQDLKVPANAYQKRIGTSTLYGMTQNFIVGLDEGFPATASTVARTAAKLRVAPEASGLGGMVTRCLMCDLPVQEGSQLWKERCAILERPKAGEQDCVGETDQCCGSGGCEGNGSSGREEKKETTGTLPMALCYGCRVAASTDKEKRADVEGERRRFWPGYARRALDQQEKKDQMEGLREQIQEFLLEDEESE